MKPTSITDSPPLVETERGSLAWQGTSLSIVGGVQWQWEHRSGWRDYDPITNKRVEVAYRDGRSFVLVKSGKSGSSPMGIFFTDMLQHDADSGNKRRVQRVGRESCMNKVGRKCLVLLRSFEKSNVVQRNFLEQEMEEDALAGIDFAPVPASDLYHKRGWCAFIARNPFFLPTTGFVILLNAIWLGFDAQYNTAPTLYSADTGFVFVENLFAAYFTFELLIRFLAYKNKQSCLGDGWFVFDSILLVMMMGEIWLLPLYMKIIQKGNTTGRGGWAVLRMARMAKLVRLGRLARIIQHWPELYSMCKAIIFAMRSTLITIILLMTLTYVFSIVFVTQLRSLEEVTAELPDFKTIHGTMWLLTIEGVLLDGPKDTLNILVENSYMMTAVFLAFIGISAFTLVNMLIGIICNVVDEVSRQSKDEADVSYLKNTMLEFLECHDDDNNRAIKKEEFRVLMRNPVICLILTRFGVDVDDLKSMENNFFGEQDPVQYTDGDGLTFSKEETVDGKRISAAGGSMEETPCADVTFSQFLRVVLRLRQTNSVKVTDVVDLREFMRKGMESHRDIMDQRFRALERQIRESFAIAAPSNNKLPHEEKLATEERKMPDLGQQILNWRGATQNRSSTSLAEGSALAEFCPLRQEAQGGLEQLLSLYPIRQEAQGSAHAEFCPLRQEGQGGLEQLLSIQAEISQKESTLAKEVLLSREQLTDIQKQVGQVCRLLGHGRLASNVSPDRRIPQATSHPWHATPAQRSLMSSGPFVRTLTKDEISADDVEV